MTRKVAYKSYVRIACLFERETYKTKVKTLFAFIIFVTNNLVFFAKQYVYISADHQLFIS